MQRTWLAPAVIAASLCSACGNDRALATDATILPDVEVLPPGCDHVERLDATNDLTLANGVAETIQPSLTSSITICARIDRGHFDVATTTVDVDGFALVVAARSHVLVSLAGTGAELLGGVEVRILDATGEVVDRGALLGSHVIFSTTLAQGTYRVVMFAKNPADVAAAIDYQLRVALDVPDTRCPAITIAAAYTETQDGPQSTRNDVVEVRYQADPRRALTGAANDAPEPTTLATARGTPLRITGTSDAVDAVDEFHDRDTFLFTTGAHDQLTVRIDWAGNDADFDFLVFPEDVTAEIGSATHVGKLGPELATFPVLPNTRYWLWIGSYDTSTGLPLTYDATVCPE